MHRRVQAGQIFTAAPPPRNGPRPREDPGPRLPTWGKSPRPAGTVRNEVTVRSSRSAPSPTPRCATGRGQERPRARPYFHRIAPAPGRTPRTRTGIVMSRSPTRPFPEPVDRGALPEGPPKVLSRRSGEGNRAAVPPPGHLISPVAPTGRPQRRTDFGTDFSPHPGSRLRKTHGTRPDRRSDGPSPGPRGNSGPISANLHNEFVSRAHDPLPQPSAVTLRRECPIEREPADDGTAMCRA